MPHPAIGSPAPDFTLPDADGRPLSLSALRRSPVVLFFYPQDDTPICTKEACAFRDSYADLRGLDAHVIGVSDDDAEAHKRFAARHALPFPLLTDAGGNVRKQYGVRGFLGLLKGRTTFVIDAAGNGAAVIDDGLRADRHVREALGTLRAQRATRS